MNDRFPRVPTDEFCLWVVGQGLIGGALAQAHRNRFVGPKFEWQRADLGDQIASAAQEFARFTDGRKWSVVWSAGRGVVGSSTEDLDRETNTLRQLVNALATHRPTGEGALAAISSAGAVYAKSEGPPFDEFTQTAPITAYGIAKCEQESIALSAAIELNVRSLVIRAANVYGRGQNMQKAQGLISHLCRTAATRQPTNLYVSGDTMRHYIWNLDLARLIKAMLSRALTMPTPFELIKVAAGSQSTTVSELVGLVQQISKIPVRVGLGAETRTSQQATDLRLRSRVWVDLDASFQMPLVAGVKEVLDGFRFPAAMAQ